MSDGFPSMTALLGLLALAGYQNKDKLAEAVKSEQAEDISDKVLDGVADFAKKIAPGAADKIDEIRDSADKAVGNE